MSRLTCLTLLLSMFVIAAHALAQPAMTSRTGTGKTHFASLGGLVKPIREAELSTSISARVAKVAVKEGHQVKKGDLLIQFDDSVARVGVTVAKAEAEAEAEVLRAKAEAEKAIERERLEEELSKQGSGTTWDLKEAQFNSRITQANLAAAKEQRAIAAERLKLEQARLADYRMLAPFDGTVIRLDIEEGEVPKISDDKVMLLADLSRLRAEVQLPAELYGKLQLGDTYHLVAGSPVNRDDLPARLTVIDPIIDSASQTFRCVFEINNPKQIYPAGFSVRLPWPQQPVKQADKTPDTTES